MKNKTAKTAAFKAIAATVLAGALLSGCGESPPPDQAKNKVFNDPETGKVEQVEDYVLNHLPDLNTYEPVKWGVLDTTERGFRVWHTYYAGTDKTLYNQIFYLDKSGNVLKVVENDLNQAAEDSAP